MQLSEIDAPKIAQSLYDLRCKGKKDNAVLAWLCKRCGISEEEARSLHEDFNQGLAGGAEAAKAAIQSIGIADDAPANASPLHRAAWKIGQVDFHGQLTGKAIGPRRQPTAAQKWGVLVFVVFCGLPAMEINGFGFGLHISLTTALIFATIGGAVGGALFCSKPLIAGIVGGLLAGPTSLLAVYYYTQSRDQVSDVEVVFVQCAAALPGLGIAYLLKKLFAKPIV